MRKEIDIFENAGTILKEMRKGILLTTKNGDKINSMTISWGQLGVEWEKPVFTVYVREGRYTRKMLESGEFTINIPVDRKLAAKAIAFCGTNSGANVDKIAQTNLTPVDGFKVSAPAFKELPMTLECKVVYKQLQDRATIPESMAKNFYPKEVQSTHFGANRDYHIMFYGEIVAAYILE